MLRILFSYGKSGEEGRLWSREIEAASSPSVQFVPFNHREVLEGTFYPDAQALDVAYRAAHPRLMRLQQRLDAALAQTGAQCLFVTNDPPYHPDYLLKLKVYRAYHTTDDPGSTYTRTVPYVHAYHHLFHCALPYSPEKTLREKLLELGARAVTFLPLGVFDFEMDATCGESDVLSRTRDIDFIYVGNAWFAQKFDGLRKLVRAFGGRLHIYGFWRKRESVYLSMHARRRVWVRPVSMAERVALYQRAKIGFNLHWNKWGLGNQRLYHLPANGVMQICDSTEYLGEVFEKGREVVPADTFDEMIERGRYYIEREAERREIAASGFRRVQRDYRIRTVLHRLAEDIRRGIQSQGVVVSTGEGAIEDARAARTKGNAGELGR